MAERENYFILLEISFDPIENDTSAINAALKKKQQKWSADLNNPVFKTKASNYLALFEDMKKVMLTDDLRKKEAEDAKRIKASKTKELEKKLMLYSAKAPELSERDLKQLLKQFGPFGFTKDDIKKRFKQYVGGNETREIGEVIESNVAKNLKNFMNQIGMVHNTLYDFLELPPTSSTQQLLEKAEAIKKKLLAKGEKTGEDNARQSICGLCTVIFKDKQAKHKYDNYVSLTKYGSVNDYVDEMATSNKRVIEPKMKEKLIDMACNEYKLSPSQASSYISNYCDLMGYQEKDKSIICESCGTDNPASATICSKCKKQLLVLCPSCGHPNGNKTARCVKCGFDLSTMDKAVEMVKKAKALWLAKDVENSEAALKEAKLLWPNHPDVISLEKSILEFKQKYEKVLSEIMTAINEKAFYRAKMKIDKAGNEGFKISSDIIQKIENNIKNVEDSLRKLKTLDENEAFSLLISMTDEITDSQEIKNLISKYPPEPPKGFSAIRVKDEISFSWNKSVSVGNIEYVLIRKENTFPYSLEDGTIVYRGGNFAYTDNKLKKSTVYCYTIFAVRASVVSKPNALSEKLVIADNVTDIRAKGGDGMITLSWKKTSTVTEVKVWICESDSQPDDFSSYRSVPSNRLDGINIKDLENKKKYWICVSACHTINGVAYESDKYYLNAVPQKPAAPISNFQIESSVDNFKAKWDNAEWDVIIFYSNTRPDYKEGMTYDYNDIVNDLKQIQNVSFTSSTSVEFSLSFIGECYIVPAQINSTNVILNDPLYISSVPPVKDISYDINASKTELYVNFTWPKKSNNSLLVYRYDDYPTGPDDPIATRIECNKKQYENNEGIMITNPVEGIYYACIYTYFDSEEHRIYSNECRAMFNNEPLRDAYYTMQYKKAGLFNKKNTLTVTIKSKGSFMFPQFCIVSKFKSVPLNRSDGDVVCTCKEATEIINGSHTFVFDCTPLRKDTRLKLFLLNDKQYTHFRVVNDGSNTI